MTPAQTSPFHKTASNQLSLASFLQTKTRHEIEAYGKQDMINPRKHHDMEESFTFGMASCSLSVLRQKSHHELHDQKTCLSHSKASKKASKAPRRSQKAPRRFRKAPQGSHKAQGHDLALTPVKRTFFSIEISSVLVPGNFGCFMPTKKFPERFLLAFTCSSKSCAFCFQAILSSPRMGFHKRSGTVDSPNAFLRVVNLLESSGVPLRMEP